MRLSPRTLDLFLIHPAEMPRRRPGRVAAGAALAAVAVFSLLGAQSAGAQSGGAESAGAESAGTESAGADTSVAGPGTSCASGDLRAELAEVQHGAGQTHAELVLVNGGGRSCTVGGYPVVFQVGAAGYRLGAPAAADGPDRPPVLLVAGGRAAAGLTLSAAGLFPECDGRPAVEATGLKVILPGGRTALPVAGAEDVLPTAWSGPDWSEPDRSEAGVGNPESATSSAPQDLPGRAPGTTSSPTDRVCAEPEPTMMWVTALAAV